MLQSRRSRRARCARQVPGAEPRYPWTGRREPCRQRRTRRSARGRKTLPRSSCGMHTAYHCPRRPPSLRRRTSDAHISGCRRGATWSALVSRYPRPPGATDGTTPSHHRRIGAGKARHRGPRRSRRAIRATAQLRAAPPDTADTAAAGGRPSPIRMATAAAPARRLHSPRTPVATPARPRRARRGARGARASRARSGLGAARIDLHRPARRVR